MKKLTTLILTLLLSLTALGCSKNPHSMEEKIPLNDPNIKEAYFAGGCFWCVEAGFEKDKGVIEVISGFSGGEVENPKYEQVASGKTKHMESIKVYYDSRETNYSELLESFWRQINPTDSGGQFFDRGKQYSTAIFYKTEEERKIAEDSKRNLQESGRFNAPIVTPIIPFKSFFPSEEYHQNYYKKNPIRYNYYRKGSGRDDYFEEVWGNDLSKSEQDLREKLTPLQYKVTRQDGTERAFNNKYWDNKEEGIYVDVVSGEPLFSSKDKYKSGTGWPSFTRPLEDKNVVLKEDNKFFTTRTEVRSKKADSHLGHLFDDGPVEAGGKRWCMNSAALRFVSAEDLEEEGYGKYSWLF